MAVVMVVVTAVAMVVATAAVMVVVTFMAAGISTVADILAAPISAADERSHTAGETFIRSEPQLSARAMSAAR